MPQVVELDDAGNEKEVLKEMEPSPEGVEGEKKQKTIEEIDAELEEKLTRIESEKELEIERINSEILERQRSHAEEMHLSAKGHEHKMQNLKVQYEKKRQELNLQLQYEAENYRSKYRREVEEQHKRLQHEQMLLDVEHREMVAIMMKKAEEDRQAAQKNRDEAKLEAMREEQKAKEKDHRIEMQELKKRFESKPITLKEKMDKIDEYYKRGISGDVIKELSENCGISDCMIKGRLQKLGVSSQEIEQAFHDFKVNVSGEICDME